VAVDYLTPFVFFYLLNLPQLAGDEAAAEKFAAVQLDFERVKAELVKMMDKYNAQYRKYADHKLTMKNKLHSIKWVAFDEHFLSENFKLIVNW